MKIFVAEATRFGWSRAARADDSEARAQVAGYCSRPVTSPGPGKVATDLFVKKSFIVKMLVAQMDSH